MHARANASVRVQMRVFVRAWVGACVRVGVHDWVRDSATVRLCARMRSVGACVHACIRVTAWLDDRVLACVRDSVRVCVLCVRVCVLV